MSSSARVAGLLTLAMAWAPSPAAEPKTRRGRWHFVFEGTPELVYSVHFTRSEGGDETRLLVATEGGRFELLSRQDRSGRDSTESVTDRESGETLSRRLVLSRHERVTGCERLPADDACVVFTGARGSVSASLSKFSGRVAAGLRAQGGALVTGTMRRRLFALAPVFSRSLDFEPYGEDFLGLLWPERFARTGEISKGTRTAGCDFDATFGRPCTDAERSYEAGHFKVH